MTVADLAGTHIGKPFDIALAMGSVSGHLYQVQHSAGITSRQVEDGGRCHVMLELSDGVMFSAVLPAGTEITALA